MWNPLAKKVTVATAGSPVALGTENCNGITIIANPANAGSVYVKPKGVNKTQVIPLAANASLYWGVLTLVNLEVDADNNGDSIFILSVD